MLQGCVRLSVVCNVLYVLDTGGQPSLEDSLWRGCGTVCALTLCIRSGVEPWNACFDALLVHQILFLDGARSETIASITPSTL